MAVGFLRILCLLLSLSTTSVRLLAAQPTESAADLVHSDLPIFRDLHSMWPRSFNDNDGFGCSSRVAFGDWQLAQRDNEAVSQPSWYSFANYGVMHCFAIIRIADERADLPESDAKISFFVFLGETAVNGEKRELWTIQMGGRPGSEYILLSRKIGPERITSFEVLQRDCPRRNERNIGSIDILLTRYCAINSRREFINFARRMAHKPPIGTITLTEGEPHKQAE